MLFSTFLHYRQAMNVSGVQYRINKLGYYVGGTKAASSPSVKECLEEIIRWGNNVTQINNTSTYQPGTRTTLTNTYFTDGYFDQNTGNAVIVLWKEVVSRRGDVYALTRDKRPGFGEVEVNTFNYDDYIPGYPVYFWFSSDKNKMVALNFDHSDRGKTNLECFIEGFITNRSQKWCVYPTGVNNRPGVDLDLSVLGYCFDGTNKPLEENVAPRVSIDLIKDEDTLSRLLDAQGDITRLARIDSVVIANSSAVNMSRSEKLYRSFFEGLNEPDQHLKKVRYKTEMSWRPSRDEIQQLHESVWSADSPDGLENMVAITKKNDRISFYGNSVKSNLELPIDEGNFAGFVKAETLLRLIDEVEGSFF